MKGWWILGILVLILLVLGIRERFTSYEDALKDVGQTAGYTSLTPICPEGSTLNSEKTMCKFTDTSKADVVPTCSSNTLEFIGGICRPKSDIGVGTTTGGSVGTNTTGGSSTTTGTNSTGGSTRTGANATGGSGTTTGTNTTGGITGTGVTPASVRKNTILGPVFTGYGSPVDGGDPNAWKLQQYPELLGGGASEKGETDLKGSMPTADGLGATEQSKFFPFSRQPGDMDLIPDPYRVSQQFSSASYSFKTEPTPYLTDFSAFLR